VFRYFADIGWGKKYFDIEINCISWYNQTQEFYTEVAWIFRIQVREKQMEISYNKLWKQMIDKGMNKSDLRQLTGIGTNTLAKLSKNQPVSMEVLMKLCEKLDCDICDVCEFKK